MINEEKIKFKVKKAISIKPTHITLIRLEKVSNGMRGGKEQEAIVAELDIFIDDSKNNLVIERTKESGISKRTRGINMLATTDGFDIKEGDYFTHNEVKYRITYPGLIVKDVYNSDLEVI